MLCNVIIQTKHIESYDFKKVFGVITKDLKYMRRKLAGDLCSNNGCNINRSFYFFSLHDVCDQQGHKERR